MRLRPLVPVFLQRSVPLVFCIAPTSRQSHKANSGSSIAFTHIPPAAHGRTRRVFVLVSLLLVAPVTSDRDGDR